MTQEQNKRLGHRLKVARVDNRIAGHRFARMLNISASYLSNLEAGRGNWSPELLAKAWEILNPKKKDK